MLTILAGKSAGGKDALLNELVNEHGFERIISTTTRPMREGERNGIDYHFTDEADFKAGLADDLFIQYRTYDTLVGGKAETWYYGSEKTDLDPDKNYVVVLDLQGARDYVNYYGRNDCFVTLVDVPDEVREERARARGSFDKTEWDRRLKDDALRFAPSETEDVVNYVQDNWHNDIEESAYDICDAMESYAAVEKDPNKLYTTEKEMYYFEERIAPWESRFKTLSKENREQLAEQEERYAEEFAKKKNNVERD